MELALPNELLGIICSYLPRFPDPDYVCQYRVYALVGKRPKFETVKCKGAGFRYLTFGEKIYNTTGDEKIEVTEFDGSHIFAIGTIKPEHNWLFSQIRSLQVPPDAVISADVDTKNVSYLCAGMELVNRFPNIRSLNTYSIDKQEMFELPELDSLIFETDDNKKLQYCKVKTLELKLFNFNNIKIPDVVRDLEIENLSYTGSSEYDISNWFGDESKLEILKLRNSFVVNQLSGRIPKYLKRLCFCHMVNLSISYVNELCLEKMLIKNKLPEIKCNVLILQDVKSDTKIGLPKYVTELYSDSDIIDLESIRNSNLKILVVASPEVYRDYLPKSIKYFGKLEE